MQNKFSVLLLERAKPVFTQGCLNAKRLIHGRGHTFEGFESINVDWYPPVLVITLYAEQPGWNWQKFLAPTVDCAGVQLKTVLVQHRYLPGSPCELVWGEAVQSHIARRGDLSFEINLGEQQNLGYFLDMEPGRQWLEANALKRRVLNLFAYTCAFSVVALQAGASQVVNVDMSSRALSWGRRNHQRNRQDGAKVTYMQENILKSWGRIRRRGPFDIIILDPPSFQKGSFVATRDYAKLVRRIPELGAEQVEVLACLNAPELDSGFLHEVFQAELPQASLVERLPAHEDFPDAEPERALKLFHYRYIGD